MALFGDDMIQVTTPDGRQITMPRGLASQFQGLAPPPAMPPPLPRGGDPTWGPSDTSALAAATPPLPPAIDQPVTVPSQAPPAGSPPNSGLPVTAPSQASDAGPSNATPRVPKTEQDLARMGISGALAGQVSAGDEKRAAIEAHGAALANQAREVGAAQIAAADDAKARLEADAAEAARRQTKLDADTADLMARGKKVADTKIDRSLDHPILSWIGVALATLGTAMQNQQATLSAAFLGHPAPAPIQNQGLQAMYGAIDRKVDAQMKDLENQRAGIATMTQAVGQERQGLADMQTQRAAYRIGYLEQAKQRIEGIKERSNSEVTKANATVLVADANREIAETVATAQNRWKTQEDAAVARKQTMEMHRESIGVQLRGQNLQQREADLNRAERSQEKIDEIATRIALSKSKGAEDMAKKVSEQGIVDPSTGDLMLTPQGQQKMAQADSFEAAARKVTDPGQAKKLNEQAGLLRDSARANDPALALNKSGAEQAQKVVGTTQNLVNNIDAARRMLEAGPEAFNREDFAQIKVALENVKINYAQTIGERLSVRALEAFKEVLSIDPDSWTSRTADKGKAVAALKTLDTELSQQADVALKSAGVKSGWQPARRKNSESFSGLTANEIGSKEPNAWEKHVAGPIRADIDALNPFTPPASWERWNEVAHGQKERAFEAGSARTNTGTDGKPGQSSNYGLAPSVDDRVRGMIKSAGAAGNADRDRIAEDLASPLTSDRPGLAIGVANLLRDEDRDLYKAVLSKLPALKAKELDEKISAGDAVRIPVPKLPKAMGKMSPEAERKMNEYLKSVGAQELQ